MAEPETILTARNVDKTFDRTRALDNASFDLLRGEIHALLGANGAGKSTLSKVISGHHRHDAGTLTYKGRTLAPKNTREALDAGIAIVMQETSLAPDLSVLENTFLPELAKPGRLSYGSMRRRAATILEDLGREHALPLDTEVAKLSAAQRQLVEIAKALALDADLIIFDEPTASLSPGEVERLFDVMARLKESGRSLIFVSHRLEEVFAITDRVTVMREGATVARSLPTAGLSQADIIRHMVGRELGAIYQAVAPEGESAAPVVLAVENLSAPPAVRDVSFTVRRGEILGLGGLVGAGRSETAETIFGLRQRQGGTVTLNGKPVHFRHPSQAVRARVGFVPEDRRVQNIVPDLSVRENLLLAHLGDHKGFWRGYSRRNAKVDELLARLDLPAHRLADASMLNFSGGMQQKIIIARWLLLEPQVLILDEPTKGVDIGTRQAIYAILRQIADEGVAVVVISSDFEELLGVATRIAVLSDGISVADLPAASLDEEKLTLLAAPRTSMQRTAAILGELTSETKGAGFWALIDGEQIICLSSVAANGAPEPGFGEGDVVAPSDTRIPRALTSFGEGFVSEPEGGLSTLLVPVRNKRQHDFGWIGLTVEGDPALSVDRIKERIASLHG